MRNQHIQKPFAAVVSLTNPVDLKSVISAIPASMPVLVFIIDGLQDRDNRLWGRLKGRHHDTLEIS